jgi:DNA-binding LacI/PurR family transcriptional regulator
VVDEGREVPTLDEVARVAGVSRSTASRVINGRTYVSAKAREAVARAVTSLGYSPNMLARSLAMKRTNSIALVVSEHGDRVLGDPFFARVLRGVHAGLAGSGLQLVLLMAQDEQDHGSMANYLTSGHVDGALVVSLHGEDPLPGQLVASGVPVVLCGRPLAKVEVPYVDADNFNGAGQAAQYLIDQGRRHIGTIAGPRDMAVGIDRLSGWRRTLSMAGRPTDTIVHADFSLEGGTAAMEQLLTAHPNLDAVFVASDLMAIGALHVLRGRGIRVPEDVAVIGFDDMVSVAEWTDPPLTTIRQDIEEMGRLMARLLLRALEAPRSASADSPLAPIITPTRLVVRASA